MTTDLKGKVVLITGASTGIGAAAALAFATALIELPPTQALLVPSAAVFLVGEQRYVFVEEATGRYILRAVQAGPERGGLIEILSGVKEGEKVVIEGNLHLIKFFKTLPGQSKQAAK